MKLKAISIPGVLRWILGGIFIVAGIIKLFDPYLFEKSIQGYRLIPKGAALPLAYILPFIELTLGFCVIFNLFLRFSLISISLLLLAFQVALFSVIIRNIDVGCGCFGNVLSVKDNQVDNILAIIRNFIC
jgi:putative oxidoreductase